MPENVYIDHTHRIIRVVSYGTVSAEDLHNALRSVMELKEEHTIYKVLVDATNQENPPGTRDYYNFVKVIPCELRIAQLVNATGSNRDHLHMVEAFAEAQGKKLKQFYDEEKALLWLKVQ